MAENGGQVKLRITWAMKLLNRVSEREREIQLGLPPGTLQNMTRKSSFFWEMIIFYCCLPSGGSNTSTSNGGNNNGGVGGGGASRSAGASALDELQQLFGQVSSYNQQQAGLSKINFYSIV